MCNRSWQLVLWVGLLVGVPLTLPAADRPADGEKIARLIDRLGSQPFAEREQASHALDELGQAALPALHKALSHEDPEIRRRAQELIRRIDKRLETAKLLEPKRLRLIYRDKTVADAVADFSRKTGAGLVLSQNEADKARMAGRKITLDTGETTYWDALDQLCHKAGLVERGPDFLGNPQSSPTKGELKDRIILSKNNSNVRDGGPAEGGMFLFDGKPRTLPTCLAGSVRVRAVPFSHSQAQQSKPEGETSINLEVTPEPKMAWQGVLEVRITRAIDDKGQVLEHLGSSVGETTDAEMLEMVLVQRRMMRLQMMQMGAEMNGGLVNHAPQDVPVRFKLATDASKTIKELQGVVVAQVQTPPQALITVDNVLKAVGQTVRGPHGGFIKVVEANRTERGQIKLRVQVDSPGSGLGMAGIRQVMRVKGGRGGRVIVMDQQGDDGGSLALMDEKGQSFQMVGMEQTTVANGATWTTESTLTFQPKRGQGEPVQLIHSGRRTVIMDVPFTLKDVPLP